MKIIIVIYVQTVYRVQQSIATLVLKYECINKNEKGKIKKKKRILAYFHL